jgi:PilZ domain
MLGERRAHTRFAINRVGRIQTDAASGSRECTITDISNRGARLFVDFDVPDQFFLLVSGDKRFRQNCRVVWRLGGEIGVEFSAGAPDKAQLEIMNSLRESARQIFSQSR